MDRRRGSGVDRFVDRVTEQSQRCECYQCAMAHAICAVQATSARDHAPHNPPVVGSSPTRPTCRARSPANSAGQVCASKTSTLHRAAPLRWIRASAVIKGTWRASAKATY